MKWFSNLPDNKHVPFPIIDQEPHLKSIISLFRPSDYFTIAGFGLGFPLVLHLWEKSSPSIHPRRRTGLYMIQVPFFISAGVCFAIQNSLYRFWGWKENDRELKLYTEPNSNNETSWSKLLDSYSKRMEYLQKINTLAIKAKKEYLASNVQECHGILNDIINIIQNVKENGFITLDNSQKEALLYQTGQFDTEAYGQIETERHEFGDINRELRVSYQTKENKRIKLMYNPNHQFKLTTYDLDIALFDFLVRLCENPLEKYNETILLVTKRKLPEYEAFKFKITCFVNLFLSCLQNSDTNQIIQFLHSHPVICRFSMKNSRLKSNGVDVWLIEAKKSSNGWVFKEFIPNLTLCKTVFQTKNMIECKLEFFDPQSAYDVNIRLKSIQVNTFSNTNDDDTGVDSFYIQDQVLYGRMDFESSLDIEFYVTYSSMINQYKTKKEWSQTIAIQFTDE